MPFQVNGPVRRPAAIALCLTLACLAAAMLCAASAQAAFYKMVLCAAGNGSNGFATATNTTSSANPHGIFNVENYCGPAPDPAGNHAFLRIAENQASGMAAHSAYASASWSVPPYVTIRAAGGYTRMPGAFNDGWRGRFWGEDFSGGGHHILLQGTGSPNTGFQWAPTSTFASHLWPFSGYGDYRRFVFELTCMRGAGCDRSGFNAVDANSIALILDDVQGAQVSMTSDSPLMRGEWARGVHGVSWDVSDAGSGIRFERLYADGNLRHEINHGSACNLGASAPNGEFARVFQPCPTGGPWHRAHPFDTATLSDGAHRIAVCAQDYSQAVGLAGTGSQGCVERSVRTDNTAPGAPTGLAVKSGDPNRYLERFGAAFGLPPNQGSPIAKVHYSITDASGTTVVGERVLAATNPTSLANIAGPKAPGDYRLWVWLEDAVGLIGPAASAPIPHDTTPPAAPQDISVTAPTASRAAQGFDVQWRNLPDSGSPLDAVRYEVVNEAGNPVVAAETLRAEGPQAISNLTTPRAAGRYTLRLWLSDAEGNVGAPASAPLSYECIRSETGEGRELSAGLGPTGAGELLVRQGEGSELRGQLRSGGRGIGGAAICVFGNVVTDPGRDFLGFAMSDAAGNYSFPLAAGPSRHLRAVYRPDQREISAGATLKTRVRPTFKLRRRSVRNGAFAHFSGWVPGPHDDRVVVVLQVKSGKGWRAFRRYRTRAGGRYSMRYRFTQTTTPTTYLMRAQVRQQAGYPYEQGNSAPRALVVRP
jgi:hypothetical protein